MLANMTNKIRHNMSLLVFFMIFYLFESIYLFYYINATYRVAIYGLLILLLISIKKGIKVDKPSIMVASCLVLCILVSLLINGINFTYDVYTIIIIILTLVLVNVISYNDFIDYFTKIMCFLSVSSLIVCFGCELIPQLFAAFPNYDWHGERIIKNCYIAVADVSANNLRNWGIFHEPGMFAVYLNFTLFMELFLWKKRKKYVILNLITTLTCFSTTGILAELGIIFAYLLNTSKKNNDFEKVIIEKRTRRQIIFIIILFLIIGVLFFFYNPRVLGNVFNKLGEMGRDVSLTGVGAGYERWRAFVYSLQIFFENPIFGAGVTNFQNIFQGRIATFTPFNWFALYGLLYGIICNFGFLSLAFINKNVYKRVKYILIVDLVIIICSQNLSNDIIIIMLIFYGFSKQEKFRLIL